MDGGNYKDPNLIETNRIDIIKAKVLIMDFCRSNDLKQSEVEKWLDDFVNGGPNFLKSNSKDKLTER